MLWDALVVATLSAADFTRTILASSFVINDASTLYAEKHVTIRQLISAAMEW